MRKSSAISVFVILSLLFTQAQSNCFDDSIRTYVQFLEQLHQSPVEYIAGKFDTHDIVVVGEVHQKREYCELISQVIVTGKINFFASEFIKHSNTEIINQIVSAKEFDRAKAIDILRDYTWPIWGFEEYLNIIHAVWEVNSTRENQQDKIKIIALDSEWSQYDNMCGQKKSEQELFKQNVDREENMVNAVKEQYADGTKILVHIGFAHALYKLKGRFASELYSKYDRKVFTVCLHQQLEGDMSKMTLSKDIETVMARNDGISIGFDVAGSPFAKLKDASCYYFRVPQQESLKDIAMGYVFIKPYSQLRTVTWILDFVNESNFEKAKCVAMKMRFLKTEPKTVGECNSAMALYFTGE